MVATEFEDEIEIEDEIEDEDEDEMKDEDGTTPHLPQSGAMRPAAHVNATTHMASAIMPAPSVSPWSALLPERGKRW